MPVFESTGIRPRTSERIFKTLMSCPATSVEAEHAFIVTKLCTSLSDDSFNMLCFLHSHLMPEKKWTFF